MSGILKIFGIGLILFSAFVFSSEYEKKIKRKERLSEGFLSLIEHIRRQIDCYLTPPSELIGDFTSEALSALGFLDLAKKEGVASAYMSLKEKLPLCDEVKSELTSLFSSFGKEYKEGTVKALNMAVSSLKELVAKEKEQNAKDIKVARTLAVAAALGTVIMII